MTPAQELSAQELARRVRDGDRRALARLLTWIENGREEVGQAVTSLQPSTPGTHAVGITGAPGSGKSTLVDQLIGCLRARGHKVGVLAIDPTSPFTGGALLGDRVRMGRHAGDEGVFIRSMANRGHLGGLALAAPHAARILDAFGADWILIETVGVGQVEVEVAGEADTTVVVVNPGWGDHVQASKAGLLEVADVFVVNKADRPGAMSTAKDLRLELDLARKPGAWRPPIVLATAVAGEGVEDVLAAVLDHRRHLEATGELETRRRARLEAELRKALRELVLARLDTVLSGPSFESIQERVLARELDPTSAARMLLELADAQGERAA